MIRTKVETMLLAGRTPKQVARALHAEGCTLFGEPGTDAHDVAVLPGWSADDGNAQIDYPDAESGAEAAQDYVDSGDWGCDDETPSTMWVSVRTWRTGLRMVGGVVVEEQVDSSWRKITIEPTVPRCSHDDGHDWQSPVEIVGGIDENPGVVGHGGGVIVTECCMRCGCRRDTDTWAQDRTDGEEGLQSVSYEPGAYADEVEVLRGSA